MENYLDAMNRAHHEELIKKGIIYSSRRQLLTEDGEIDPMAQMPEEKPEEAPEDAECPCPQFDPSQQDIPGTDYGMQGEIIKFFSENPGADPQTVREYARSCGIDPEEFQFQSNILLSQLIQLYVQDAEDLGYGDSLTADEVDPNITSMVTPPNEEGPEVPEE